ncbi:MAG: metal ABC transporter substrate-binding protein [Acidobacteriota bacterium]|nr:metal ABC transporter substrate-binding protein [Acidobacteriota bacterium]
MRSVAMTVLAIAALLALGCGGETAVESDTPAATGPLSVYTVNYPLAYFAERVGGEMAEVHFPAPAGIDPAHWSPSAEEIGGYQQADLVLLNGAGYAEWTETAALPRARLIDTSYDFERPFIMRDQAVTHSHGPMGEHSHREMASTVWLDPTNAASQASFIAKTFAAVRPDHAAAFEQRRAALVADLEAIDADFASILESRIDTEVLASHPLYDYFARRYRLDLTAVTWEPHEAPTAEMWAYLDELHDETGATWMIWDGEPLAETRSGLDERGLKVVVLDPLSNRPESGDFLTVLRGNVESLRSALAE